MLCAGLIGYRAYRLAGDARTLGIYGFGAAAHLIAQVATAQGRKVFAFTRRGDVVSPAIPATEPLKNQCQHFLQSVTSRRPPLTDANDGLRMNAAMALQELRYENDAASVRLRLSWRHGKPSVVILRRCDSSATC